MSGAHRQEVQRGERFEFGKNWSRYLAQVSQREIDAATSALCTWFEADSLAGKSFLDVGSGSGLHSLAAARLNARVHSFDFDAESVACTQEMQRRFGAAFSHWRIESGSVLDRAYLDAMGPYDIVYSWGVLHHTGKMYEAFSNVVPLVAGNGKLFIAIYNHQGWITRYWTAVKRAYNKNALLKGLIVLTHAPYLFGMRYALRAVLRRGSLERGMDIWYDMLDWLGGYPFEAARPEEILAFFRSRGLILERLKTCGSRHGCNEYLFTKL